MELKPTCSRRLQSRMAVMSAPLCPMNETRPFFAMPAAKVALSPEMGFMTPRQLGPMTRMPKRRACSATASSSAAPSAPISLKPAEMTTVVGTPASPHSAMMPGIEGAGVTMMHDPPSRGWRPRSGVPGCPGCSADLG
jgi:hypothetical protein